MGRNKNKNKNKSSGEKKSSPAASSSSSSSGYSTFSTITLLAMTLAFVGVATTYTGRFPRVGDGVRHAKKAITSFEEFYPFYLTEHSNPTNRALHVAGTTILLLLSLNKSMRIFLNLAIAISVGLILSEVFSPVAHGFFEFGAMMVTALLLNRITIGSFAAELVVVGYFFAWLGHFAFEGNRPATFIYPTFSLLSDFRMWYEVLTLQLPIQSITA